MVATTPKRRIRKIAYFTLSDDAKQKLRDISQRTGFPESRLVERAIRELKVGKNERY